MTESGTNSIASSRKRQASGVDPIAVSNDARGVSSAAPQDAARRLAEDLSSDERALGSRTLSMNDNFPGE